MGGGNTQPMVVENVLNFRVRKLTPKECFRLMGYKDELFKLAEKTNSNTQLYKQAGNGIVVNCLVAILGQFFENKENCYKNNFTFE